MTRTRIAVAVVGVVVLQGCAAGSLGQSSPHGGFIAAHHRADPIADRKAHGGADRKVDDKADPRSGRNVDHRLLAGKVITIDPGHQLGNFTHSKQVDRLVNAGGFKKPCNTTGTETNGGFKEATFTWNVANALRRQLQRRGATVYMTRTTNSYKDWGPCVNVRGRFPNKKHADVAISIHGDGAPSSERGFFVIRPADRKGWTDDIFKVCKHEAHDVKRGLVRAGVRVSNAYGGDGYSVRGDLGTLNWSNVPVVMVEMGNMRNATDAKHMTTPKYRRHHYARGLRLGITRFLLG